MIISHEVEKARTIAGGALEGLKNHQETINGLNVFPIPDGDTGTNMYLTVLVANESLNKADCINLAEAVDSLARGALLGSRGNSGFILSQFLEGLAQDFPESCSQEPGGFLHSVRSGVDLAYGAVENPLEGTVLTVLKDVACSVERAEDSDAKACLLNAHEAACESLRRTPLLLEALSDARAVDAGGAGIVAALEGALKALNVVFRPFEWDDYAERPCMPKYHGPRWGMQFTFQGGPADADNLRKEIKPLGESIIFAGVASPYRVHIHTDHPEQVLEASRAAGAVTDLDVVGLASLVAGFRRGTDLTSPRIGVISCCPGNGLARLFKESGSSVVECGPGSRPSAGLLINAARDLECEAVFILPNDGDSLPVARKAAEMAGGTVMVIPTQSPVQGLAALEEYIEDGEPSEILREMSEAASRVRCGFISKATRNARLGGFDIKTGQYFGVAEQENISPSDEIADVARRVCLNFDGRARVRLLTLVAGQSLEPEDADAIRDILYHEMPEAEQEWYDGGQPYYELLIGAE